MVTISPADLDILVNLQLAEMDRIGDAGNAANKEKMAAMMADEAAMAAEMAEGEATFKAADTNADGMLDLAEFKDWCEKTDSSAKAKGWHTSPGSDDDIKSAWEAMSRISGKEGVTYEAIMGSWEQIFAKVAEKRGE